MDIPQRLETATAQAEAASAKLHQVVNGDATTEIPTESGSVPSLAKWYADLDADGYIQSVATIADLLALPEGKRKEGLRYLVKGYHAGSDLGGGLLYWDSVSDADANDGTVLAVPGIAQGRFIRPSSAALSPEMFGARTSATAAENATAISACLNALKNGQAVVQESSELITSAIQKTIGSSNNRLYLRLQAAGDVGAGLLRLLDSPGVELDRSIDVAGNEGIGVYLLRCSRARLPKSLWVGNIHNDQLLAAGVFTRDSDDCDIGCTVENVYSANAAARGVMISDQTITKNTSHIHPTVKNIRSDNSLTDADGLYAEFSGSPYSGGLRVQGGVYQDCQKRFIKLAVPAPVVSGNVGRNNLPTSMFSFIASYSLQSGSIRDNDMEALSGSLNAIESDGTESLIVGPNRFVSGTVLESSKYITISGRVGFLQAALGECEGFEALLKNYGDSTDTGQHLVLSGGRFDNGSAEINAIELTGDFSKLKVADVECVHSVANKYLVYAPDLSDYVAEIVDNRHSYGYGRLTGSTRELNAWEKKSAEINSDRVVCGTKILKRNSIPTSGSYLVADRVERQEFTVDTNNMVLTGWICTEEGTPGTWTPLRSSTVSPAT